VTNFSNTSKRKYVHHHKKGDAVFPGVKLKMLKRTLQKMRKRNMRKALKTTNVDNALKLIRPKKREKRVHAYKEYKP
jgi:Holliday junction resolvase RusA-like endonuclease